MGAGGWQLQVGALLPGPAAACSAAAAALAGRDRQAVSTGPPLLPPCRRRGWRPTCCRSCRSRATAPLGSPASPWCARLRGAAGGARSPPRCAHLAPAGLVARWARPRPLAAVRAVSVRESRALADRPCRPSPRSPSSRCCWCSAPTPATRAGWTRASCGACWLTARATSRARWAAPRGRARRAPPASLPTDQVRSRWRCPHWLLRLPSACPPQALTYFPPGDEALLGLLCRWVAAFPRCLRCHISEDAVLGERAVPCRPALLSMDRRGGAALGAHRATRPPMPAPLLRRPAPLYRAPGSPLPFSRGAAQGAAAP